MAGGEGDMVGEGICGGGGGLGFPRGFGVLGCGWFLVGPRGGGMEVRVLRVWCAEGVAGVLVVMCGGGQTGHGGESRFREPQ